MDEKGKNQRSFADPKHCREVIFYNSRNKNRLNSILCSYPLPHNIQLVNQLDCVVTRAEADITLCSYMLKAVEEGAQTIRILSNEHRRLCPLGVLDIEDASCRQDSNGKVKW